MRTANWMTGEPISVLPTTSLTKCQKLLKMHNIRRLPVVDEDNHVIGIISDRDIKSASPSKASSLEVHEMQYLLAEVKARDIMTANPVTVTATDSISDVAKLMLEKKIGGIPVVDENNCLTGIITDHDIFKLFVDISGAHIKGIDITIECGDEPGTLAYLLNIILRYNARIISILTSFLKNGDRHVFLRVHPLADPEKAAALRAELESKAKVLEWSECR